MARSTVLEGSVKVTDLDGVERCIDGIRWNTKVGELLLRLYPEVTGNPKATDQLKMLEVWRGCINPLENNLRVSSVIGKWGYLEQTENDVQLMVVKKSRLWSYHTAKQQMKRQKYRCGKVARRKLSHQNSGRYNQTGRSKKAMVKHIQDVMKQLSAKQQDVTDLLTPKKPLETPSVELDSFPADQRKQAEGVLEAIADETSEKEEAVVRKGELSEKISSQQKLLSEMQKKVSGLEAKALNEQHKLNNLAEVKGPPEVEEILKETSRIKNELKVRTKLNRLLSTKMQELTGVVIQVEDELKMCQQEIELLKLSTPL